MDSPSTLFNEMQCETLPKPAVLLFPSSLQWVFPKKPSAVFVPESHFQLRTAEQLRGGGENANWLFIV